MVFLIDDGELLGLGVDYVGYIKQLNPALWFRFDELAGATAINSGSLGAAYNATYTACTLAQTGKISPTSAVLFDGVDSKITVPAGAYSQYPAQTIALLLNATSVGEGNAGRLWAWDPNNRFNFSITPIISGIRATAGNSVSSTLLTLSVWRWLFCTIDMTGDKKIHYYIGANGAVSEVVYTNQVALTVLYNVSATALTIGNLPDQSRTMAGLYDEWMMLPVVLSPAQMTQITKLSGA